VSEPAAQRQRDPFEHVRRASHEHREAHSGGCSVSANLFLAQFVPDLPGIAQMAEYRQRILDDERLLTAIVPGGLAVSIAR
jgi:hypothetical protein